jgi:hypothetical protein
MNLTTLESQIYTALCNNTEGCNNDGWMTVYLDNARPSDVTARQFASILGSLQKKGLYRSDSDDFFGKVRIEVAA